MNWGKTAGLQSPENAKILFGLSMSPQIEDVFSREALYYDFKLLLCVRVTLAEGILTASEGVLLTGSFYTILSISLDILCFSVKEFP